jgi:hypothetical protein
MQNVPRSSAGRCKTNPANPTQLLLLLLLHTTPPVPTPTEGPNVTARVTCQSLTLSTATLSFISDSQLRCMRVQAQAVTAHPEHPLRQPIALARMLALHLHDDRIMLTTVAPPRSCRWLPYDAILSFGVRAEPPPVTRRRQPIVLTRSRRLNPPLAQSLTSSSHPWSRVYNYSELTAAPSVCLTKMVLIYASSSLRHARPRSATGQYRHCWRKRQPSRVCGRGAAHSARHRGATLQANPEYVVADTYTTAWNPAARPLTSEQMSALQLLFNCWSPPTAYSCL